ncbi:hypothetical protein OESDEN_00823 [Oesophagostomum dentatum]|uniref:Uncharacterized protein n=1 Tax=Oesophagostomum dentatum TaxID=61180 RepID=A0A0B1TUU6_OESDE|nr:hypothetical protein OESDEN_00823 [Oesophagostomum dentatum]
MSKKVEINKRDVYQNCLEFLQRYIAELSSLQEGVFETLKSEFKPEHVCDATASDKYLKAIEKFISLQSRRKIYSSIVKCYHVWKNKLQPAVGDGLGKNSYAELPLRLAACFMLNGDYYKALLCLRHSIHLEPRSLVPRIIALRWSAYLGEWEMAEMSLAFEKAKPPKRNGVDDHLVEQLVFTAEITQAYVDFNRDQKSRPKSAKTILEMTGKANADERLTFPVFETQAFANWIAAQLPKVAAFKTDDVELLDTLSCVHTAILKAESVMKNRIPAIQKEDAPLDFLKVARDPLDFMKACSAYAENCDLRRDYTIELLNVGMIRDGAANSQLGLWCAIKTCVLFRVQQFVNVNFLIRVCVILPELKKDLAANEDIMRTMYAVSLMFSEKILDHTNKLPFCFS